MQILINLIDLYGSLVELVRYFLHPMFLKLYEFREINIHHFHSMSEFKEILSDKETYRV